MAKALFNDALMKAVGASVRNHRGEAIGKITEVIQDEDSQYLEYVVLGSNKFFGRGNRYFAIPASSTFIDVNNQGKVTLQLDKDEIQFAKGVAANKCPKPNFKSEQSIFELYNYQHPDEKTIQ